MGQLTFITGGARSGKSTFAEARVATWDGPVVYLATMEALDDELSARVARHRSRRPRGWTTIEEPYDLVAALDAVNPAASLLLDCVSLWVSNLFMQHVPDVSDPPPQALAAAATAILDATNRLLRLVDRPGPAVVVTNEVGSGVVPVGAFTRAYRDILGLVNQRFATASTEAFLLASGLPIQLK